jgi:LytR cell envelope-related transcriptional attenuator
MTGGPKHLFRHRRSPRSLIVAGSVLAIAVVAVAAWILYRAANSSTGAVAPSSSHSSSPGSSPTPRITGRPKITGVVVLVLNGTTRTRLAARTSQRLAKAGYTMDPPANSPSKRAVTLIEYQPRFGPDAAFIQHAYFPHAVLQQSSVPFPSGADITVVLGRDIPV